MVEMGLVVTVIFSSFLIIFWETWEREAGRKVVLGDVKSFLYIIDDSDCNIFRIKLVDVFFWLWRENWVYSSVTCGACQGYCPTGGGGAGVTPKKRILVIKIGT